MRWGRHTRATNEHRRFPPLDPDLSQALLVGSICPVPEVQQPRQDDRRVPAHAHAHADASGAGVSKCECACVVVWYVWRMLRGVCGLQLSMAGTMTNRP
jgi:hypothetical protein